MPKIKTADLTGIALDWAVAQVDPKCEGLTFEFRDGMACGICDGMVAIFIPGPRILDAIKIRRTVGAAYSLSYRPSSDWSLGGPIIECDRIQLYTAGDEWLAKVNCLANNLGVAPTPLVAAMRAYVASKSGDSVDIPDQLHKPKAAH